MKWAIGVLICFIPAVALATGSDVSLDDAVKGLAGAYKAGKWAIAAGFLITILVQLVKLLVNVFKKDIPTKYHPWIAAVVGVLGGVGLALSAGVGWVDAVVGGVTVGTAAGGLWSLLIKHVYPKKGKS